ncbi:hypothetical protein [Pseudomonas maumuensis]|uniref:Uncharacterized protein n=1 Tax=Pseudomonas maumuensis TaxID=2842354 RepID=A0ABX8NSJ3_9PSED|nr:hypothetical protein [Pseudomonas maumuensis]QXH58829.1 hypothetical protein KSS90_11660 [Pseudomonas maumuensis]
MKNKDVAEKGEGEKGGGEKDEKGGHMGLSRDNGRQVLGTGRVEIRVWKEIFPLYAYITAREDAETGKDSTVGLNRDLDKAYEITRDHESRTDLYLSDSSVNGAIHPVETLSGWTNELRNYDKAALKNYEQVGNAVNVLVNRFERLQGRQLDANAVAVGGVKLAEDTYEALLMANFKPDEAKALMRTSSFSKRCWHD